MLVKKKRPTKKMPTIAQLRMAFEKANKLSVILEIALHDMQKAELSPNHKICMSTWYRVMHDGICRVCLAGSVIAARYSRLVKCDRLGCIYPDLLRGIDECEDKLYALNELRMGCVSSALRAINKRWLGPHELDRPISDYNEHCPGYWWGDMGSLLGDLRAAGL